MCSKCFGHSDIHITKYINKALNTKHTMKSTTQKRTQWSQSIIDSGQNQLKYTYRLQQGDKAHHTKHTTTHGKVTLMLNHPSLQNKTTDVVIHQHIRKLLKMDILMSEKCWGHSKWNKIASDIKLIFHSSTVAMVHGPINIRSTIEGQRQEILSFRSECSQRRKITNLIFVWPCIIDAIT